MAVDTSGGKPRCGRYVMSRPHLVSALLQRRARSRAYMMGNDGSFGPRVQATGGVYVSMTDVEVLKFVEVAGTEPETSDGPGQGEGTSG